jgi:hypothetical protein
MCAVCPTHLFLRDLITLIVFGASPRPCVTFRDMMTFCGEELVAPLPFPNLEDHRFCSRPRAAPRCCFECGSVNLFKYVHFVNCLSFSPAFKSVKVSVTYKENDLMIQVHFFQPGIACQNCTGDFVSRITLEDYPLLTAHDCLFNISAATLHFWRPPSAFANWGRTMSWWLVTHLTWLPWRKR